MMSPKSYEIHVLDIGSRYGIHPTWKSFNGNISYHLVEADKNEALRLKKKYKNYNYIKSYFAVMGEDNKEIELNFLNNVAMTSILQRKDISPLYWNERKYQSEIKKTSMIKTISLNYFIKKNKITPDFIKLDVEGYENTILKYGDSIFNSLLGARSEVSFTNLYKEQKNNYGSFNEIHELFTNNNFVLLNLDYDGKGDYFSKYLKSNSKYGILQSTDAIWIKDPFFIKKNFDEFKFLKVIIFCILNNAIDVALWLLQELHIKNKKFLSNKKIKNITFVKNSICRHFYTLKWVPGQILAEHKNFYETIFNDLFPEMNEFNESPIYNPY